MVILYLSNYAFPPVFLNIWISLDICTMYMQIYCHQGYYMEGHNIASCQANGDWTHLPTCRGKSYIL